MSPRHAALISYALLAVRPGSDAHSAAGRNGPTINHRHSSVVANRYVLIGPGGGLAWRASTATVPVPT